MSDAATVARKAHAKVNVFLRVLGRRADGYHDIETLVLPISLHDDVVLRTGGGGLHVDGDPGAVDALVPGDAGDDANLAVRALALAAEAWAPGRDVETSIRLTKRIPVAAGLGGGSADAAATLRAAAELWEVGDPGDGLPGEGLTALAAAIGSDVPAMVAGEPVIATGRGERLTAVHVVTTWWVLQPLPFAVRAADAYRWWDARPATGPDPGALIAAAETGDVELLGTALCNDLQAPVAERHPAVADTIGRFLDAGALGCVMSGSGPTVAALARHVGHAGRLADAVPGSIVVSGPIGAGRGEG